MAKVLERGLPQDAGKERVLFGNIAQIYEWHREWVAAIAFYDFVAFADQLFDFFFSVFQKEIEACGEEPERLGGLFVRYVSIRK